MRKKESRFLYYQLTTEEIAKYSDELARKTQDLQELEDRKKEVASDMKAKIDVVSSATRLLARKITTRQEEREIDCEWEYNWEAGTRQLKRIDTGEIVDNDIIPEHEKQQELIKT